MRRRRRELRDGAKLRGFSAGLLMRGNDVYLDLRA
jgi:hypothetical protein